MFLPEIQLKMHMENKNPGWRYRFKGSLAHRQTDKESIQHSRTERNKNLLGQRIGLVWMTE